MKTANALNARALELGFDCVGRARPTQWELEQHRCRVTLDDCGLGGGCTDRLRELGVNVTAFNGAHRASKPERYANKRAESYFLLRERMMYGRCAIPDDPKLIEELLATCYTTDPKGRILVEGKDILRSKLRRSPDRADVCSMSCEVDRFIRTFVYALSY
jgi:hypothetical protein